MKITKQRLKEIIREELSLGDLQTEPRHEGGTAEEKFINKLTIVAASKGAKSGHDAAKLFGLAGDEEGEAYLDDLLKKELYAAQARANDAAWEKEVGPQGDEMELEEYRGEPERRSTYRGEPERPSTYRQSAEEREAEKRKKNYRSGATGKKNQGRGGY